MKTLWIKVQGWHVPLFTVDEAETVKNPETLCPLHGFLLQTEENRKADVPAYWFIVASAVLALCILVYLWS